MIIVILIFIDLTAENTATGKVHTYAMEETLKWRHVTKNGRVNVQENLFSKPITKLNYKCFILKLYTEVDIRQKSIETCQYSTPVCHLNRMM